MTKYFFVGAHPDDIEFGCAGTIKAMTLRGCSVFCVVMTNGEKGGGDAKTRKQEQIRSFEKIGCKSYKMLNKPDLGVKADDATVSELAQIISFYKPSFVFTHAIHDKHPDHIETTRAVQRALEVAKITGVECELIYFSSFSTLAFSPAISISHGQDEAKREALLCHDSQIKKYHDRGIDFIELAGKTVEKYEIDGGKI